MTRRERVAVSRHAFRALAAMAVLICLRAITALVLILRTTRTKLLDLVPVSSRSAGYVLLAWRDLERGRNALRQNGAANGTPVRVLGYLAEGGRYAGFVLLPDAGNALHPAHRFGDRMIGLHLPASAPRFQPRDLVWAYGEMRLLPGDPEGHEPLYLLEGARIEPAAQADIARYFR